MYCRTPVVRYDENVSLGDRPKHGMVERQIERENLAVERLERIVVLLIDGKIRWVGRRGGAAAKQRGQHHGGPTDMSRRGTERQGEVHERLPVIQLPGL